MLWYDKAQERRVRGRLGEFRELTEHEGKGWREFDLAPQFGQWVAQQKWFERAAKRPSTLSTVLPQFEDELVRKVRGALKECGPNDLLALTGVPRCSALRGLRPSLRVWPMLSKGACS